MTPKIAGTISTAVGAFIASCFIISSACATPITTPDNGSSCGQWVSRADRPGFKNTIEAWVVGYLSGIAFQSKSDMLNGSDAPSIFMWVDNYCRSNPLEKLSSGTWELSQELKRRSQK